VFIPSTTPRVKREGIAALGATIDDGAPHYDAAHAAALAFARERELYYVDPCSGAAVLAGQGTVALEILEECPELASLVVAVGGGGLLAGIASLVRRVAPHVRIAGAQSEQTAAMKRSLDAGRVVPVEVTPTLAEGLAGQIEEIALDYGRHGLDELALLTEDEIAATIVWLAREEGAVVEGSAAVAPGVVLHRRLSRLATPAVVIVTGGNIDRDRHTRLVAAVR
jgi:threonine dehydratase